MKIEFNEKMKYGKYDHRFHLLKEAEKQLLDMEAAMYVKDKIYFKEHIAASKKMRAKIDKNR